MKTGADPHDDIIPSASRRRPRPQKPTTKRRKPARRPRGVKVAASRPSTANRQPLTVKPRGEARQAAAPWTSTHKLVGFYCSDELRALIESEVAASHGTLSKSRIIEMEVRKRYGLPPPPPGPRTVR